MKKFIFCLIIILSTFKVNAASSASNQIAFRLVISARLSENGKEAAFQQIIRTFKKYRLDGSTTQEIKNAISVNRRLANSLSEILNVNVASLEDAVGDGDETDADERRLLGGW